MSTRPCQVLWHDQHTGRWRPCEHHDPTDGAGSQGRRVCPRHRRELARLEAAGLAGQVRYATDPPASPTANTSTTHANAHANPDAHAATANGDAQTTLPIPEPTPRPYPWQRTANANRGVH